MKIAWECDLATAHVTGSEIGPAGTCPSSKSPASVARTLERQGEMKMKLAKAALFFTLASAAAWAQVNIGEQKPEASLPFTMTTVATFNLPWRHRRPGPKSMWANRSLKPACPSP